MKSDWESTDGHVFPFRTCIFGGSCHCYGDLELWHRHPRLVQVKTWQALLMQKKRPEHFVCEERWYEAKIFFFGIRRKLGVLVLKFFVKILYRCFEYIQVCVLRLGNRQTTFEEHRVAYLFYLGEEIRRLYSKMYSCLPKYQIVTPKEWFHFGSLCCDTICQEEHFFVNSCQCLLPWMVQLYF